MIISSPILARTALWNFVLTEARRALVTGASRGIGRAVADALLARGWDVIAVARASDDLDGLAAAGATVWAIDVTSPELPARIAELDGLDALVNNAGTARHARLADTPPADIDAVLDVNLRSPLHVTRAAIPKLRGGGSIVNITSTMGHVGAVDRAVYCATKFGLEGLTKALAVELAPQGIRVNSVAPTFVATAMTAPTLSDPDEVARIHDSIPLGRIAEPSDMADAVLYLLDAAMVTGHSLVVDGGWTAR